MMHLAARAPAWLQDGPADRGAEAGDPERGPSRSQRVARLARQDRTTGKHVRLMRALGGKTHRFRETCGVGLEVPRGRGPQGGEASQRRRRGTRGDG
eukprot:914231-Rhodomonas_salina.1